jgi:hypothetical protein
MNFSSRPISIRAAEGLGAAPKPGRRLRLHLAPVLATAKRRWVRKAMDS